MRDGTIRDVIRSSGDERLAVEGLLGLSEKGLDLIEGATAGQKQKWLDLVELALKTLATWTRQSFRLEISFILTPNSLGGPYSLPHSEDLDLLSPPLKTTDLLSSHTNRSRHPDICHQRCSKSSRTASGTQSARHRFPYRSLRNRHQEKKRRWGYSDIQSGDRRRPSGVWGGAGPVHRKREITYTSFSQPMLIR